MSNSKGEKNMERFQDLKVGITGGAGFIGSHLVERLLTLGADVVIIDNFLHGSKVEHLKGHKHLSMCEANITDAEAMIKALQDKDLIFHFAAVVGVEETQMDPLEVLSVEIQGTVNILNAVANSNTKRIIFGSSSEVYGDSPEPMNEEDPFSPKSTYAVAKLVGEEYCKAFYHRHGIKYTILRYFNIYGPRQDERFVISRFVNRTLANEPISIYGDGEQTRDFTYIDDAVNMTLLATLEDKASCQAINIGTDVTTTINELAHLTTKIINSKNPIKPVYVNYDDLRPREIEVFSRTADISKARKLLQYEPETPLESGVRKYIDWYLEERDKLRRDF